MKNYFLFLALAATATLSSCGKDDDTVTTPAKTRTELLTAAPWKTTALTISPAFDFDGDGVPESDLWTGTDPCDADDVTVYKADKTYTEEEGATKCDPTDDQVYGNGTWTFSSDESKLITTAAGAGNTPTEHNITELTANTLKYNVSFMDSTTTYTVSATMTH